MKHITVILFVISLLLSGCSKPSEPDYQATIDVLTTNQTELSLVTNTSAPTDTQIPTDTAVPTDTPIPTSTSTVEPTEEITLVKAKNFVASEEQNDVIIEVERILICDKTWKNQYKEFSEEPIFNDKKTYIEFIFRVTNNTDKVISFNFFTSVASANGEQIIFEDYIYGEKFWGWGGDDIDEDILPGSMVRGYVWTGVKRTSWDEINKIIISIPYAIDKDYNRVTDHFLLEIEVGDWGFEPLIEI